MSETVLSLLIKLVRVIVLHPPISGWNYPFWRGHPNAFKSANPTVAALALSSVTEEFEMDATAIEALEAYCDETNGTSTNFYVEFLAQGGDSLIPGGDD